MGKRRQTEAESPQYKMLLVKINEIKMLLYKQEIDRLEEENEELSKEIKKEGK